MSCQRDQVVDIIRSVLISSKGGVQLSSLKREYYDLIGEPIPYNKLGYPNLEEFLHDGRDFCYVTRDRENNLVVCSVATEKTRHVQNLVAGQNSSKKKKKSKSRGFSMPLSRPTRSGFSRSSLHSSNTRKPTSYSSLNHLYPYMGTNRKNFARNTSTTSFSGSRSFGSNFKTPTPKVVSSQGSKNALFIRTTRTNENFDRSRALEAFCRQRNLKLVYGSERSNGKFMSTVTVNGESFTSSFGYQNHSEAEEAAADKALKILKKREHEADLPDFAKDPNLASTSECFTKQNPISDFQTPQVFTNPPPMVKSFTPRLQTPTPRFSSIQPRASLQNPVGIPSGSQFTPSASIKFPTQNTLDQENFDLLTKLLSSRSSGIWSTKIPDIFLENFHKKLPLDWFEKLRNTSQNSISIQRTESPLVFILSSKNIATDKFQVNQNLGAVPKVLNITKNNDQTLESNELRPLDSLVRNKIKQIVIQNSEGIESEELEIKYKKKFAKDLPNNWIHRLLADTHNMFEITNIKDKNSFLIKTKIPIVIKEEDEPESCKSSETPKAIPLDEQPLSNLILNKMNQIVLHETKGITKEDLEKKYENKYSISLPQNWIKRLRIDNNSLFDITVSPTNNQSLMIYSNHALSADSKHLEVRDATMCKRIFNLVRNFPDGIPNGLLNYLYKDKFKVDLPNNVANKLRLYEKTTVVESDHSRSQYRVCPVIVENRPRKRIPIKKPSAQVKIINNPKHTNGFDHRLVYRNYGNFDLKKANFLHLDRFIDIYITRITDPSNFYIQSYKDLANLYEEQVAMTSYYNKPTNRCPIELCGLKVGDFYAVRFVRTNCWYRAEIRNISIEENVCRVYFVDFGVNKDVAIRDIQYLHENFRKAPVRAVCASLSFGKKPDDFNQAQKNYFDKFLNRCLVARVENALIDKRGYHKIGLYLIDTSHPTDDVYINDKIDEKSSNN